MAPINIAQPRRKVLIARHPSTAVVVVEVQVAEALRDAYGQAHDEYVSAKAAAEKESKRRVKVTELHTKVDTLAAVEAFLAWKRD